MSDAAGAISLYAHRLRVCRLNAAGAPAVGQDNLYVTDAFVRVDYTPRYETTDAVTKPNGRGGSCLNVPARSRLVGVDLVVELCQDDPMLSEMLAGGTVLTEGTGADVVGYQLPKANDPEGNGVSLEFWAEAWTQSGRDPVRPWFWYAVPKASLTMSDRSVGAELDNKNFEGNGAENGAWGNGPGNDWRWDSTAAMQYVRTATAPPAVTNGYAAVVADAVTPAP